MHRHILDARGTFLRFIYFVAIERRQERVNQASPGTAVGTPCLRAQRLGAEGESEREPAAVFPWAVPPTARPPSWTPHVGSQKRLWAGENSTTEPAWRERGPPHRPLPVCPHGSGAGLWPGGPRWTGLCTSQSPSPLSAWASSAPENLWPLVAVSSPRSSEALVTTEAEPQRAGHGWASRGRRS